MHIKVDEIKINNKSIFMCKALTANTRKLKPGEYTDTTRTRSAINVLVNGVAK